MLKGKKVNLRFIRETDLEEMINVKNNLEERGEFDSIEIVPEIHYRRQYAEGGMWKQDFGIMLITDKSDKVVGLIQFFKASPYLAGYELGYDIFRKEDRGKGYGSEALKLFSSYLFAIKPINRLQLSTDVDNIASCRIAEKCGFTFEGIARGVIFSNGKYDDLKVYSILRKECPIFNELITN